IWTAYGWWLPNDPRGSGSREIGSDVIAELGELHYGRKRVQPSSRDVKAFYEQAARLLRHPLLTLDEDACASVVEGFTKAIEQHRYTCYACAIMPDHVHILIRKHKHQAEEVADYLREAARCHLVEAGLRASDHPVWTGGDGWKVFLDHPR